MDNDFFKKQVERLKTVYSASSMPDERVALIWGKFKNVENYVFRQAVDYMISEHTSQSLPAASKFSEAVGYFKDSGGAKMNSLESPHTCEACNDFGYGFVGDLIVKCTCSIGEKVSPVELVKQQRNYERGAKFMPALKNMLHLEP